MTFADFTITNSFRVNNLDTFKAAVSGHGLGVDRHGPVGKVSFLEQADGRIRLETLSPFEWLDRSRLSTCDIPDGEFHDQLSGIIADHIAYGESAVMVRGSHAVAIISGHVETLRLGDLAVDAAERLMANV